MTGKNITSLLLAGSLFLCCGFAPARVKRGVVVDGVLVGGMSEKDAVLAVREKLKGEIEPLVINTPAGQVLVEYPEISFTENLSELLRSAKRGEELHADVERVWVGAEEYLLDLCARFAREGKDAELSFSADGFTYTPEENALVCDYGALLDDCMSALKTGEEVTLRTYERAPEVTLRTLRARTRKLASYTTSFSSANGVRCANIRLAARRIAGTVVPPKGEFSFNAVVGKRTRENGFGEAPVILDGEFVQGVGGGVCQASTTLFNAAIRAGMRITESHPHSLSVSYVPPSLDAMVSEYADMRFVNPYPFPVYVQARTGDASVTFTFYGMPDGKKYKVESVVLFREEPPPEKQVEGEEEKIVRKAKEGLASESYLLVYEKGALLSRTLIRRDKYACVQGIRQVVPAPEEPNEGENSEDSSDMPQ